MKSCNAQARTNSLKGDARKSFMSDCLSGKTTSNTATPQQNAPPQTTTSTQGTSGRTNTTTPKSMGTAPPATAAMAGQFGSVAEAQRRCPSDNVVWANNDSKIYHFSGTRYYGNTKQGAYMCQQDSDRAGFRAAKNETPPG